MRWQAEPVGPPGDNDDEWQALGGAIRKRRLSHKLTMVELASQVDLSQPFLSQVENGRARPSLMSLQRIATALGTTPQSLFGGATEAATAPVVVRAEDGRVVEVSSESTESICHLLIAGDAPFHLLEFDGLPNEFLEYFAHDGFEAVYVTRGRVEIDVDGDVTVLRPGDSVSYPSRLPHRLRSVGKTRANALLIETKLERSPVGSLAPHTRGVRSPETTARTREAH